MMLAAQGVLTSFRSVSTLIGLEVAGTSGASSFVRDSISTACWKKLTQLSGGCSKAATQAQPAFASQSASHAASSSSWSPLACARQIATQSSRAGFSNQTSTHCTARSFAAGGHRSFKTQATGRSMWQRDYYQSGYSRGYGYYWDGDKVLYGLIAANIAGFFLWQSHPGFMRQQATVSVNSIREGRIHTLLTSAFSHASLSHLFANMFTFYFFGRDIGMTFGGKRVSTP